MRKSLISRFASAAFLALALPVAALAVGPKGVWMLTDGDHQKDALIQGGSVNVFAQADGTNLQYPIQWAGSRNRFETVGRDQNGFGGVYDLSHNLLATFGNFSSDQGQHLDGTLDTKADRSYSTNFTTGDVDMYGDGFFDSPTTSIFNAGAFNLFSITYAQSNGDLFLGGNGTITEITTGGVFVKSFNSNGGGAVRSLAYDALDNSLWYLSLDGSTAHQTDLDGNELSTMTVNLGGNYWGGEIAPVPEPATMTALGLGLLAIARRRKSR